MDRSGLKLIGQMEKKIGWRLGGMKMDRRITKKLTRMVN